MTGKRKKVGTGKTGERRAVDDGKDARAGHKHALESDCTCRSFVVSQRYLVFFLRPLFKFTRQPLPKLFFLRMRPRQRRRYCVDYMDDTSSQTSTGRCEREALLENMELRTSSREHDSDALAYEDALRPATIDFHSVALYIPVMQVVCALVACCTTALLSCWLLPYGQTSSVRTATLATIVGCALVSYPIRIAPCIGLDVCFRVIQPCVPIYVTSLVVEQLTHGAVEAATTQNDVHASTKRTLLFNACMVVAAAAGMWRALKPLSEADYQIGIAFVALVVTAMAPPLPEEGYGPLADVASGWVAAERYVRAITFGSTFCATAYASGPRHDCVVDIFVCSLRAAASSIWVLGINVYFLPLIVPQLSILAWQRMFSDQRSKTQIPLSHVTGEIEAWKSSTCLEMQAYEETLVGDQPHLHDSKPAESGNAYRRPTNSMVESSRDLDCELGNGNRLPTGTRNTKNADRLFNFKLVSKSASAHSPNDETRNSQCPPSKSKFTFNSIRGKPQTALETPPASTSSSCSA